MDARGSNLNLIFLPAFKLHGLKNRIADPVLIIQIRRQP